MTPYTDEQLQLIPLGPEQICFLGLEESNPLLYKEALENHNNKTKLRLISATIQFAEDWCEKQLFPESVICLSALKDIRRIISE